MTGVYNVDLYMDTDTLFAKTRKSEGCSDSAILYGKRLATSTRILNIRVSKCKLGAKIAQ